ncbi:alpha/beta hydrolase [Kitasatospora paranensis]|uniref:Alpha/beta hydrolase n=1 Tax=Kitasatospora paranensis TaxID=258053 RepID=A0ABW2FYG0_9ACTN
MPLHPQAASLLTLLAARQGPPPAELPLTSAREATAGLRALQAAAEPVAEILDTFVPGAAGLLPVRVYRPKTDDPAPRALLVHFHGGGWATGGLELVDRPLRRLANVTGAVVAGVGYRLAPETRFPGPAEDAYAAVAALHARAAELGADPERVVVAGDSAGGNLAAAVCLMARDRGGPHLAAQLLLYPVTAPAEGSPFGSYEEYADGYLLTRDTMRLFWNHYLADPADAAHPYAAPLHAPDLTGLPPALVITAEYDVLRDEGEAYARRLREAGVPVRAVRYAGAIHGFFWLPGVLDVFDDAADDIRRALHALPGV